MLLSAPHSAAAQTKANKKYNEMLANVSLSSSNHWSRVSVGGAQSVTFYVTLVHDIAAVSLLPHPDLGTMFDFLILSHLVPKKPCSGQSGESRKDDTLPLCAACFAFSCRFTHIFLLFVVADGCQ